VTILVTGATGFIGGAIAARLIANGHSVLALVRAPSESHARARVARSVGRFGPRHTVRVLVGDLAEDGTYDSSVFDEVTHVVHAAACTSFAAVREAGRTNVDGTRKLANRVFCTVRRFLHVSTAYCCGDRPKAIVHEDDAPRPDHTHVNEYARSKAHAELSFLAMDWRDRLLIARPSVVIGHSSLGVRPSSSLFWYYRAMAALRCGAFGLDDRRDIVPVDYVADALAFLLELERPRFRTYHVSAGERASVPLRQILRRLSPSDDWTKVPATALANMSSQLGPLAKSDAEATKLARGMSACARFAESGIRYFDNSRLLSEGFRPPPSFLEYIDACVESSAGASVFEQMVDDG